MGRLLLVVLALSVGGCGNQQPVPGQALSGRNFRNIVFLIGDDHSAEVVGCYGNSIVRTPNLDRMASRGVRFNRAYVNSPLCSASRQSMLTGRYPHAAGVTLLTTPLPEEQVTIAEHLLQAGFRTGAVGKMHFNNELSHGFEEVIGRSDYDRFLDQATVRKPPSSIAVRPPWKPFVDPARIWLNADALPSRYFDDQDLGTFYARQASGFIRRHQMERFCLWVGFHEPHSPFNFPIEYQGRYSPEQMPLPLGSPEDDRWVPAVFRNLTDRDRTGIIAAYYTSVEYLDKNVGIVLDSLEETGLLDQTLVVYVGDNGYLLNDHKRFEKHTMWEPAIRVPLILLAGARLGPGVREVLVETVDLAPTLLEALGMDPLPLGQGKSLWPVLEDAAQPHKDFIYAEFLADNKAMVRSEGWKYIFTTGKRDLQQGYATGDPPSGLLHRLYDLRDDPGETTNVVGVPSNAGTLKKLQAELLNWFRKTDPRAERISPQLPIEEQLAAFCEPPEGDSAIDGR